MDLVLTVLQIAGLVFFVLIILALAARAAFRKRATRDSARGDAFGTDAPGKESDR